MMPLDALPALAAEAPEGFRTSAEVFSELRAACTARPDWAEWQTLGTSEEGRPIGGAVLGRGPLGVSLIAGAHADEPVGPETLRTLIRGLLRPEMEALLRRVRFVIVPHINPDGEARNRPWAKAWPDLSAYLRHRAREKPGRDLEFGFPSMRPENEAVAAFLAERGPYDLHMSLHGMGFSDGAWLLIERRWAFRTERLQEGFASAAQAAGLRLHDRNRKGEKGFFYIGPGFSTTPEGAAMRTYFRARGDEATAGRFHDSSMEYARSLGGDPLCLVTELPLFLIDTEGEHPPGEPSGYFRFLDRLAEVQAGGDIEGGAGDLRAEFGLRPLPLKAALRLQLEALRLGLSAVRSA